MGFVRGQITKESRYSTGCGINLYHVSCVLNMGGGGGVTVRYKTSVVFRICLGSGSEGLKIRSVSITDR